MVQPPAVDFCILKDNSRRMGFYTFNFNPFLRLSTLNDALSPKIENRLGCLIPAAAKTVISFFV